MPLMSSGWFPFRVPFVVPPLLNTVTVIDCMEISLLTVILDGAVNHINDAENGKWYGKEHPIWHGKSPPFVPHAANLGIKKPPEGGAVNYS